MRTATLFVALTIFAEFAIAQSTSQHNYKPIAGYVPNAATAIRIAVAVWTPIYGEKKIAAQAPYSAELIEGVWHVTGSLRSGGKNVLGGTAVAEIAKEDGKVIRVSHGM
jgi:hypothetical protein